MATCLHYRLCPGDRKLNTVKRGAKSLASGAHADRSLRAPPTRMSAGPSPDRSKAMRVPSFEVTLFPSTRASCADTRRPIDAVEMIAPAKPVPMNRRLLNKRADNWTLHFGLTKKRAGGAGGSSVSSGCPDLSQTKRHGRRRSVCLSGRRRGTTAPASGSGAACADRRCYKFAPGAQPYRFKFTTTTPPSASRPPTMLAMPGTSPSQR